MPSSKDSDVRLYAPDYVSEETLAYRQDCRRGDRGIDPKGALPRPHMIGGLRRWDFARVRASWKRRTCRPGAEWATGSGGRSFPGGPGERAEERAQRVAIIR